MEETKHSEVAKAYRKVFDKLYSMPNTDGADDVMEAFCEYVSLIDKQIKELNKHVAYLEEQIKVKDKAIFRTLDELDYHERESGFRVDGGLIRALIDATSTDNQP